MTDGQVVLWTAQSRPYARPSTSQLIQAIRQAAGGQRIGAVPVGLCVPGLLDKATNTITLSVNVPGLVGVPLATLLREALGEEMGVPHVISDAVAAAYDIWFTRRLAGRLLALCLGTGVGAAVIDDGVPLRVDGDSPGHIGQLDVSIESHAVIGPDGGAGSLEGYLGAAALAKKYGPDLNAAIAGWRGEEVPLRALARAIRICHAIYRPHHVFLAGGLGIRMAHLLGPLKSLVDDHLTSTARPDWQLLAGQSDHHAALGAARLAVSARPSDPRA